MHEWKLRKPKLRCSMKVLVVGSGAREHIIVKKLKISSKNPNLYCFSDFINPAISQLTVDYKIGDFADINAIADYAKSKCIELAIIGPEKPLEAGVTDVLLLSGIKVVGPSKKNAFLESSKSFTRDLLSKYKIHSSPQYKKFDSIDGISIYLKDLKDNYVIKADGLAGGKGVKVFGKHVFNDTDAMEACANFLKSHSSIVIEEKLIGEEFSLHSFVDGKNLVHMPVVQDYKLAYDFDKGPNTGGMGSYSDANLTLPFIAEYFVKDAEKINEKVIEALALETNQVYKGILYGSYMLTNSGVKVIEYNVRFGDPECINILSLLNSDFLNICMNIADGCLKDSDVVFSNKATVCKYLVPEGYPNNPKSGQKIKIGNLQYPENLYYASVVEKDNILCNSKSRSVAYVAVADDIQSAYDLSELEVSKISGKLFYRKDIGSKDLINLKIENMKSILVA